MKRAFAWFMALALLAGCFGGLAEAAAFEVSDREAIEAALNLKNMGQEWTYSAESDAWTLSVVTAVTKPVIESEEGVSVCVPGAYVTGIDTDGDGAADVTAETASGAVAGALVIDYEAEVTSENGQVYTADTAPVILNTGAAGYGNSTSTAAAATYAAQGYVNVACGNRGKQDSYVDESGDTVYTGDAPSCLADQKAAARFVKYNILLGNLPGSVDYWVSTGGSGGGAHAVMFAATSNHPDFYDYQIELGAVGVYRLADGSYSTEVTIDGEEYELSDGAWGCVAYSAITPLYEADMALAFEYTLNPGFSFNTDFQQALAGALSREYMDYINEQDLTVDEEKVGFDLDGDGALESTVALTIEYDEEKYAATNGYGGSYLDLYLAELRSNLQWYVDNLAYAEGWTWFDADGSALSDEAVAAMSDADRALAFIEGRYAKGSTAGGFGGPGGGGSPAGGFGGMGPSGMNGRGDFGGEKPDFEGGEMPDFGGEKPDFEGGESLSGDELAVGTPDAGTTQAAGSAVDSKNYASYDELLAAYEADLEALDAGDRYGNNPVDLYNPLDYIGDSDTEDPDWLRIVCGAVEGDIAMFNSLNVQLAALNADIEATIEWQWDGGHVPGEVLGESLALWVDRMVGEYADDGVAVEKAGAIPEGVNGDAESPTGTDLSGWVTLSEDGQVDFTLADGMAYRTSGASKAVPGFDVIDYGQEDYVFGDEDTDARHWSEWVLEALEDERESLEPLFNQ